MALRFFRATRFFRSTRDVFIHNNHVDVNKIPGLGMRRVVGSLKGQRLPITLSTGRGGEASQLFPIPPPHTHLARSLFATRRLGRDPTKKTMSELIPLADVMELTGYNTSYDSHAQATSQTLLTSMYALENYNQCAVNPHDQSVTLLKQFILKEKHLCNAEENKMNAASRVASKEGDASDEAHDPKYETIPDDYTLFQRRSINPSQLSPQGGGWTWWALHVRGECNDSPCRQRAYSFLIDQRVDPFLLSKGELTKVSAVVEQGLIYGWGWKHMNFPFGVTLRSFLGKLRRKAPLMRTVEVPREWKVDVPLWPWFKAAKKVERVKKSAGKAKKGAKGDKGAKAGAKSKKGKAKTGRAETTDEKDKKADKKPYVRYFPTFEANFPELGTVDREKRGEFVRVQEVKGDEVNRLARSMMTEDQASKASKPTKLIYLSKEDIASFGKARDSHE
eukprot:GHVN01017934.1.p1 GENE.GHVN01017934.1~~GHVN01017934.1.p1  ORF type:complete len:448 (+),score=64.59 GHVN01017934.1:266-1609(+)